MSEPAEPKFFSSPAAFRRWLEKNHDDETELVVGFHKRATGKPSMTWQESVAEALCFGWIDGVTRSAGADAYTVRFTPRKPRSIWSAVNIRTAERLIEEGRMTPAGLRAFEARSPERSRVYSFEQEKPPELEASRERALRRDRAAWAFFQAQPPWYRRAAAHWVESAKKTETREKRFATLLACSAEGRAIPPLSRKR